MEKIWRMITIKRYCPGSEPPLHQLLQCGSLVEERFTILLAASQITYSTIMYWLSCIHNSNTYFIVYPFNSRGFLSMNHMLAVLLRSRQTSVFTFQIFVGTYTYMYMTVCTVHVCTGIVVDKHCEYCTKLPSQKH